MCPNPSYKYLEISQRKNKVYDLSPAWVYLYILKPSEKEEILNNLKFSVGHEKGHDYDFDYQKSHYMII